MTTTLARSAAPPLPSQPSSSAQRPSPTPAGASSSSGGVQPRSTQTHYSPFPAELHQGAKNRLFLCLRSDIPAEVDWALPRLVAGSHELLEHFDVSVWVDSVLVLQRWPERWVEQLEREAAYHSLVEERQAASAEGGEGEEGGEGGEGSKKRKRDASALGALPSWTSDPATRRRACDCLQILRNASLRESNAKHMARAHLVSFLERFFALPLAFLTDLAVRHPEPVLHILYIFQSIFPLLPPKEIPMRAVGAVLPALLLHTRDTAMILALLPLLISAQALRDAAPPTDPAVVDHLMMLVTLSSTKILEMALDLLISLTQNAQTARAMLADAAFPRHLKGLTILLEHSARPFQAAFDPPKEHHAVALRNPAGMGAQADDAVRRRAIDRERAQAVMRAHNGQGWVVEVGDKPPVLATNVKKRLYQMREPLRSVQWMHETFVYSSNAHLPQVTFWHAYRDFFGNPNAVEQMLSASEVIKNVNFAFPGSSARVWTAQDGTQKFVIAGIGFRKGSEEEDRFVCLWRGCRSTTVPTSPTSLFNHVLSAHLTPMPKTCGWAQCHHSPCTTSHVLTHTPVLQRPAVPEYVTSHPSLSAPEAVESLHDVTHRPVPPLPKSTRLMVNGHVTPVDAKNSPTGIPFLAALVIRNLARVLRVEMALAAPERQEAKRRHLMEERFGLPIPPSVMKEEEEEEKAGREEEGLTSDERERARRGFESVERGIGRVVEDNMCGVGQYLSEAWGW